MILASLRPISANCKPYCLLVLSSALYIKRARALSLSFSKARSLSYSSKYAILDSYSDLTALFACRNTTYYNLDLRTPWFKIRSLLFSFSWTCQALSFLFVEHLFFCNLSLSFSRLISALFFFDLFFLGRPLLFFTGHFKSDLLYPLDLKFAS